MTIYNIWLEEIREDKDQEKEEKEVEEGQQMWKRGGTIREGLKQKKTPKTEAEGEGKRAE